MGDLPCISAILLKADREGRDLVRELRRIYEKYGSDVLQQELTLTMLNGCDFAGKIDAIRSGMDQLSASYREYVNVFGLLSKLNKETKEGEPAFFCTALDAIAAQGSKRLLQTIRERWGGFQYKSKSTKCKREHELKFTEEHLYYATFCNNANEYKYIKDTLNDVDGDQLITHYVIAKLCGNTDVYEYLEANNPRFADYGEGIDMLGDVGRRCMTIAARDGRQVVDARHQFDRDETLPTKGESSRWANENGIDGETLISGSMIVHSKPIVDTYTKLGTSANELRDTAPKTKPPRKKRG